MEFERYEVQGRQFEVAKQRIGSWRAFQLLKEAEQAEDIYGKIDAVMSIACYITDMQIDEFIEHCGGEDTPMTDVLQIASELVAAAYPKN